MHLALDERSDLPAGALRSEDLVTIVGNLIDNALDALSGHARGRITVLASVKGGDALLEVRDDGPGLPADALEHMFEAGWSTKPGSGAARRGLGLALVHATVTRLGGMVAAANDGGAVLTVRVPVRSPDPVAAPS